MAGKYFFCVLAALFALSCTEQTKTAKAILDEAETIVEEQPDSAFRLLNTIYFPEDFGKKQYNRYVLLRLQAKDKSYRDITEDTLIFAAKTYYEKKNDVPNAALAAYYCGRVLHEQQKSEEATEAYRQALQWADKTGDYNLKGLIHGNLGILFREHYDYSDAIEEAKSAVEMYKKVPNFKNEIISTKIIGDCFLLEKQPDSAFFYYNKSLKVADSLEIAELQSGVRESMGVAYREEGNYQQAKKLFDEALTFPIDTVEQARILLNIAQVYLGKNQMDSVEYYLFQAMDLPVQDMSIKLSIYYLLSKIHEKKEQYQEALKYHQDYHDYTLKVYDSEENMKIQEMQEKYNFDVVKNKNLQLSRDKWRLSLIALLVFILLIFTILTIYIRYMRKKEALLEIEEKINVLQKMQAEERLETEEKNNVLRKMQAEKDNKFREMLFKQFDIVTKTATLKKHLPSTQDKMQENLIKRFNNIVYERDTLDWDTVYQLVNQLHNDLYDRICEQYPNLNEMELKICCLSCGDLDNEEMGIMLQTSSNYIMKQKSDIRKKTGMPPKANLYDFFQKKWPDIE